MSNQPNEEQEYPHWNRVYAAVIFFTCALILVLWLITRQFNG
jgi:hypothetical protein